MSAATPGPWTVGGLSHTRVFGAPPGLREISYMMGQTGEDYANARLIAAAPGLRDLLSQAVEASGFSLSGPTDVRAAEHGEPAWVCRARALLAAVAS